MDASPLGFEVGQTPFEEDIEITFGREGVTCGTGDEFVTSTPKLKTDIVDMEAFAIAKVCKLKNIDFDSTSLTNQIAFHDFEGVTVRKEECERLSNNLGKKSVMILRNHGLLSVGSTIAHAFIRLHSLERACLIQTLARSTNEDLIEVSDNIAKAHANEIENSDKDNFWIIDPIDGTTNFLHGVPHFAISIALKSEDEIISGSMFTHQGKITNQQTKQALEELK